MSVAVALAAPDERVESRWLFSRGVDLTVFLGSAAASVALLWIGARFGLLDAETPEWTWVVGVLLVDVAHVYSTGVRVYLDSEEVRRRPLLYTLTPALAFVVAAALYAAGQLVFWRTLAYLAVFHFVRQQYGWVAMYRRRCGERDRLGHWLDAAAVYAATLYPLAWWHANLPRKFFWFLEGDFLPHLPSALVTAIEPLYWALLAVYALRSLYAWLVLRRPNPGKDIVVATTALCWYLGIVAFNSDYAFAVTNVLIHGIPYIALIYASGRRRQQAAPRSAVGRFFGAGLVPFVGLLWALAYMEELLWHRTLWQEREWLFGAGWDAGSLALVLVPLLAMPQITHYVLDGFIWRKSKGRSLY